MGKIIGGLLGFFLLRSFFGIIIGILAGHFFIDGRGKTGQRRSYFSTRFGGGFGHAHMQAQIQEMYFKLFFSMLGKMAKADGTVTKSEGNYFLEVLRKMNLSGDAKTRAITYFNEAKNTSTPITHMAQQFSQLCAAQPQLKRQMLNQLIGIANADGNISTAEETLIKQVASIFSILEEELNHLFSAVGVSSEAAYHVLGVSKSTNDADVKKAYRKLIKEYHPDVLRSKGLPEELIRDAQKRFLKIQEAWEIIKKEKKISE